MKTKRTPWVALGPIMLTNVKFLSFLFLPLNSTSSSGLDVGLSRILGRPLVFDAYGYDAFEVAPSSLRALGVRSIILPLKTQKGVGGANL